MTPMHDDENVNYEQFAQEVDFMLSLPITGLVVGGSTGEGHALTVDELTRLTGVAALRADGRVPVVTGILDLPQTRLALVRGTSHSVARSSPLIEKTPARSIAVHVALRGEAVFEHGGRTYRVRPGELIVCDPDEPFLRAFDHGLACGFTSAAYFSQSFHKRFGVTAGAVRRRGGDC